MSDIAVIGLGALNTDYLYKVERILDDEETMVDEAKLLPGGSAANTIYGLAKLGVKSGFVCAVGDDAEGELSIQDLRKVGVDTSQIKIKPGV
jgi:ribokinase